VKASKEIRPIPLEKVVPPEIPVRMYLDDAFIRVLAQDLSESGQIQNIVVRPKNDKYEVVIGHNRYVAAKKAGMKTISARVVDVDDYKSVVLRLKENTIRQRMGKVSEAMSFQTMKVISNKTWKQIAADVPFTEDYIKRRVRLLQLAPEVQVMVEKGLMHPDAALELLRLPEKEYQMLCAKKIIDERLTVEESRYLVTKQLMEIEKAEAEEEAPPLRPTKEEKPVLRRCTCCGEMVPEEQIAPRYLCAACYGIALRAIKTALG